MTLIEIYFIQRHPREDKKNIFLESSIFAVKKPKRLVYRRLSSLLVDTVGKNRWRKSRLNQESLNLAIALASITGTDSIHTVHVPLYILYFSDQLWAIIKVPPEA